MSNASTLPVNYATDPHLLDAVKKFLKPLNGGGPGLETLSKEEARKGLIDAQAAFKVDLSGIDETEKTITHSGYTIKLTVVRPKGATGLLPGFLFIHGGGWI